MFATCVTVQFIKLTNRSHRPQNLNTHPFALAFALYIPQFFGTQPIRVAHGLLVTIGCVWIAAELWRVSLQPRLVVVQTVDVVVPTVRLSW